VGAALPDPLADLVGEVEPAELGVAALEEVDDPEALEVVLEASVLVHELVERVLARVAEGRVAEVVRERDRLREVLVETESARDRARDLRDIDRVGEPR